MNMKYPYIAETIEAHAQTLPEKAPDVSYFRTDEGAGARAKITHGSLRVSFPAGQDAAKKIAAKYRKGYRRQNGGGRGTLTQREIIKHAQLYVDHIIASGTNSLTFWPWWAKGTSRGLYAYQQMVLAGVLGYDLKEAKPRYHIGHIPPFPGIDELEAKATAAGWTIRYADPEDYKMSNTEKAAAKAA